MDSLDTNILLRYYVNDDARQSPLAAQLLDHQGPLWVPVTVLLEFVWVLQSHVELGKAELLKVLRHAASFDRLRLQHAEAVENAIALHEAGIEFDDALHLSLSAASARFWTFDDKGFARKARRLGLRPDCALPTP